MSPNNISIPEAATRIGSSPKTVWNWIKYGYRGKKLFAVRVGRLWKVNFNTLQSFLSDIQQ